MQGSLAGWRAWALARGDSAPTEAADAAALAALVRGSDHVRRRYIANLLPGFTADTTPDGHDLPLGEEGAYIAASLELATPNLFSRTYTPAEQKVLTGVGSIRWTPVGGADKTYAASPSSTALENLFEPFIQDRDRPGFLLTTAG